MSNLFKGSYIKLDRIIMNWQWYQHSDIKSVFIHCLLKANHENKIWQGININRGQFVTSYSKLANETGLTVRKIRTSLNRLKSTQELTYQTTSKYTIITVNKYDDYQKSDTVNDNQMTCKRQTNDNQMTTNNNDNNDNNDKNDKNFFYKEKNKKFDPYINPIKKFVIDEYTRIFKTKPFLSNQDCLRIVELSAEHEDIKELITIALTKLKTIKFDDINFKPSINWLLKNNNFERVLNGEFENEEDTHEKEKQELREKMKREGRL